MGNSVAVMPLGPPTSTPPTAAADFRARARELDEAHRRRTLFMIHGSVPSWLYRWLRSLVQPVLGGPALLPRRPPPAIPIPGQGECSLTFIGHATTLIRYARARVLTDPCLARNLYSLRRARPPVLPDG